MTPAVGNEGIIVASRDLKLTKQKNGMRDRLSEKTCLLQVSFLCRFPGFV
jgi:hypothetical protein